MFLAASGSISRFPARLFSCSPQFRQSLCVGHCAGYCATQGSAIRHPFPVLKNTRRILSTFSRCAKISGPPTSQIFWGHRGGCYDSHRRFFPGLFSPPSIPGEFHFQYLFFASGVSCFLASGASGPTRKPSRRQEYSAYPVSRPNLCFLLLPKENFNSSTFFASGVSCFLASGASGPTRKPIRRQEYSAFLVSRPKLCFLMLPNL
jgi:hypothetical protein